jgi:RNA polymerase sigma factor (sigma-70 family)
MLAAGQSTGRAMQLSGLERTDPRPSVHGGDGARRPPDEVLMDEVRAGDGPALGALMERHWLPLVRYVARSVGGWDEGEDVAQEVFVRVWRGRSEWRPGGSVRSYLYQIARNLTVDRARHADVRARSAQTLLRARGRTATPVEVAIRDELRADFEQALSELAPRRREAFVLVRLQGLTLREAGEVMELTPRTVANHVYLAVTDLAEALRQHLS